MSAVPGVPAEGADSGPPGLAGLSEDMRHDFAVVIPAFNEAPVIPDLVRELREVFEAHGLSGQVILVDDGSTDGTAQRTEAEGGDWPLLEVLRHRTNLGKTEAMLSAAAHSDRVRARIVGEIRAGGGAR